MSKGLGLKIAVGIVVIGTIAFGVTAYNSETARRAAEEEERGKLIDETRAQAAFARHALERHISNVCKGAPLQGAPTYARTAGSHSWDLVNLESGPAILEAMPEGWNAPLTSPPELVICHSRTVTRSLPQCGPYAAAGGGGHYRYFIQRNVRRSVYELRAAATGTVIDTLAVEDRELPVCQEYYSNPVGADVVPETSVPTAETGERATAWIRSHAEIQ